MWQTKEEASVPAEQSQKLQQAVNQDAPRKTSLVIVLQK